MAKILEQKIVVKLSKLVPDTCTDNCVVDEEFVQSIKTVADELTGDAVVVEVITG